MADKGEPEDGPSLEMPSFSLRRKTTQRDDPPTEAAPEEHPEAAPAPPDAPAPEETLEAVPPPVSEPPSRATRTFSAPSIPLPSLPSLSGIPAAAVTGAVVGGLALLLTWLAVSSCDVVRGTKSCGGGPGFLILVAVLFVLAWAGGLLLAGFGVSDATSTSFLAVGVMAVVVMLFLLDAIYDWWIVIAIPVVSVLAYIGSWWITTSVIEDDAGGSVPTR